MRPLRTIALLVPVTSRGRRLRDVAGTDLLRTLVPSVLATATWTPGYAYRIYAGFDAGDAFYDVAGQRRRLQQAFRTLAGARPIQLILHRSVGTAHSPCSVWNALFARAYAEGCDFFYQLGDDVAMETAGWARELPGALLQDEARPGVGVAGPIDRNVPEFPVLTQALVSRAHMEIFGTFYPPGFRNWFSDNWLTEVYSPGHVHRVTTQAVRNTGGAERYRIDEAGAELLNREVPAGRMRLQSYLRRLAMTVTLPPRPRTPARRQRARIYYIPNGYDFHIADALDRLFTTVKPFGCRDVRDYIERRILAHETPDATRIVIDEVRRMRPDFVYAESAYNIAPEAFDFIRKVLGIPVTMWYGDPSTPPGEVERLVRYAKSVDWQVVVDGVPVDAAHRHDLDNVELVPYYGYDHYFRPRRIAKRCDVLFSGKSYDGLEDLYPESIPRRDLVRRIDRELGQRLHVIGEGWERYDLHHVQTTRVPEWEINTLNNGARIVLCYDAAQLPGYTSCRTWHALLSGAFILIRKFPGIEAYFENHRHLAWFETEDEALDLIRHYLANDAERLATAKAGHQLVQSRGWMFSTFARYLVARGRGREHRRFAEIHGGLGPVRRAAGETPAAKTGRVSLVCFATPDWEPAAERLAASALRHGVDLVSRHGVQDVLGSPFHFAHLDLFTRRRGYGYWIWKPHFIRQALERAAEGDVVIYADAGLEFVAPLAPLVDLARTRTPVVSFGLHGHTNRQWTKRDAFVALGCDSRPFWDAEARSASLILFRKCPESVALVDDWLRACTTGTLVTDDANTGKRRNLPGFREHRHDQALLSLLCEQCGFERFRDPSQWGRGVTMSNSPYGTVVNHHRDRAAGTAAP